LRHYRLTKLPKRIDAKKLVSENENAWTMGITVYKTKKPKSRRKKLIALDQHCVSLQKIATEAATLFSPGRDVQ
jgi:hypothetical protein